jgi:hypothetical protein
VFDLSDKSLTRVKTKETPVDRLPESNTSTEPIEPDNPLDSEQNRELHRRLMSYYRQELDRQSENRLQMAIDEDYYDNIQWSEDEAAELKERGQAAIVYNVIAPTINWVIGSEKRGRTDFKILPRNKDQAKQAEKKTKYLKYLSDVNKAPFHRSRAFEDAIKVGIGWLEDGAQDEDDGEPIYTRYENWRNMLHDSAATELDNSDSRYQFRSKWVDVDVAKALFKGREAQIYAAIVDSSMYGSFDMADGDVPMDFMEFDRANNSVARTMVTHNRQRVRLIECEYRVPETVQRLKRGMFKGEIYDPNDPNHQEALLTGASEVANKVMMRVRVAHMTVRDLLWEGPSPYKHNQFRFTPIWCNRRGRDNLPYGMIRTIRDIQDDINKRASKAQHILSTNKVVMDEGALPDGTTLDEFAEEVSRSDGIIIKRKGFEMDLNVDRELAPAHLDLMSRGISMIQQTGGVTDELLGRTTNAISGVAVEKRQEQGSLVTNKPFDNLRLSYQIQGEKQLSLIEQYVTEPKSFRITNMRGVPDFEDLNDGLPENDITKTKADFVISEAEWRTTMRQAASETLMEVIQKMPAEIALIVLDLAIDTMDDLPNKDEFVNRIRAASGQKDPEATEVTPEEQAKMEAAAKQQQFAEQMAMAELEGKVADTEKKKADARKADAAASREEALTMQTRVDATNTAMLTATSVIQMPTIAKVADGILQEAGWKDFNAKTISSLRQQGLPPQNMAQPETMGQNNVAQLAAQGIPQPLQPQPQF